MALALAVWMNGSFVGLWDGTRGGVSRLTYAQSWVESAQARPLSLSLPITATRTQQGPAVERWFDNLLPDSSSIRRRLQSRWRTPSSSPFDLLAAIGRDCAGAVQLLPDGMAPEGWDRIESEPMSEQQVARHLDAVTAGGPFNAQGDEEDLRLSLAGAQEKTALLRIGSKWHRPRGATPTTHILKLPLGLVGNLQADMRESVENEWLCAQILRALGRRMAGTEMGSFAGRKVLVVERFDRGWRGPGAERSQRKTFKPGPGDWIARLPQEDLCQALGVPPEAKYESDGGPGMAECLSVLAQSENAVADRADFIKAQFVFWLLAATDGHGKNFSIAHRAGNAYSMTPLYDVLSAWPVIGEGPKPDLAAQGQAGNGAARQEQTRSVARHPRSALGGIGGAFRLARAVGAVDRMRRDLARLVGGRADALARCISSAAVVTRSCGDAGASAGVCSGGGGGVEGGFGVRRCARPQAAATR
jgi:serine/threonine-protein kinase HipA